MKLYKEATGTYKEKYNKKQVIFSRADVQLIGRHEFYCKLFFIVNNRITDALNATDFNYIGYYKDTINVSVTKLT